MAARGAEPRVNRDAAIHAVATCGGIWGGGSRFDLFVVFGISPNKCFTRLARVVDSVMACELTLDAGGGPGEDRSGPAIHTDSMQAGL